MPLRGAVSWWSPEKVNFESIQAELDDLIMRATNIATLKLGDELFNSQMYAIHAEIDAIQVTMIPF